MFSHGNKWADRVPGTASWILTTPQFTSSADGLRWTEYSVIDTEHVKGKNVLIWNNMHNEWQKVLQIE